MLYVFEDYTLDTRRDELRRWWLDFLGPMPAERKVAPKLTVLEEDRPEGVIRQLVRYEVEPGITAEAYLLKPVTITFFASIFSSLSSASITRWTHHAQAINPPQSIPSPKSRYTPAVLARALLSAAAS